MSRKNWPEDKLFLSLLNNKSDKAYWENIRELRTRGSKEIFSRSYLMASSGNDREKKIAIDILAQLGAPLRPFYKPTIKLLFELLQKNSNPDVLSAILYAIGNNNQQLSAAQIAQISFFKSDANKNIRQGVVFSLLGVDKRPAINILTALTTDRLTSIRNWATFGIGSQTHRKTKNISDALWNRMNDRHQDTRFEAIMGLAVRKDIRVKEIIKRELSAENFGRLLFQAIAELADTAFLPVLEKIQNKSTRSKDINQSWLDSLNTCIADLREKRSKR